MIIVIFFRSVHRANFNALGDIAWQQTNKLQPNVILTDFSDLHDKSLRGKVHNDSECYIVVL